MATTWIKPIHKAKGRSVAATLADSIGYADNPDKTNGFEYVKSYGCDYYTAANEFALAKQIYEQRTGRGERNGDIIGYHLRQSFKPGEITPQEALEVGYALAEKFTHGKHQFVVAVHTDKEHIHCHCIFSAVNMDCSGKFRNPIRSMKIVRQISDYLCAERGLSIVENPEKSRGSYRDWQDKKEPQSNRDKLCKLIDDCVVVGRQYGDFLAAMKRAGCEVKLGKYVSFKIPGAERYIRLKSLGEGYTEEHIRERLRGVRDVAPQKKATDEEAERKAAEYAASMNKSNVPSLLIDIQQKIREGAGEGYRQWMAVFNLKQSAKTLIFLQEQGIDTYEDLCRRASAASGDFHRRNKEIREIEGKQKDIAELQKQIGTYIKTRKVYETYRKSGWDKAFYETNRADITLHRAAKKYFDAQGLHGTVPAIASLKQEWATLESERKLLYSEYRSRKENYTALATARANAERILGITPDGQVRPSAEQQAEFERTVIPKKSRDYGAR
ncbi:MAG: relaxase/mobilization nuclease domain-containing protein [Clostridiales bacterium]|jgi:hypothetical protein|nr:relaxase/mobilization nuclease domain-containing protein [Clostridiales bacterium]